MHEYEPREISHEWLCLHMKLHENLVAATAANHLDDVYK